MKNKPHPRFVIVPLLLLGSLAGCAAQQPTETQNRMRAYWQGIRSVSTQFDICMRRAQGDAAFVALEDRFTAPLTDTTTPTQEDVANLRAYFPMQKKCRSALIDEMEGFSPRDAALMKKSIAAFDAILIDLIERKITWGESAKRRQELTESTHANAGELHDEMAADVQKQHKNELRVRRMSEDF